MSFIKAISYYLPEPVLTNEALVGEFPEWSVEKVAAKIGVDRRHLAADGQTAGDMAEQAARRLFSEHGVDPADIDFVLLCTQSPDYFLPSTACVLQHRLGIPTTAGALDYNLGCSGCVYGLAMATGLIEAGIASNVLVLTAETYSRYLHPTDKSNRSIFGDGAAACLVSNEGMARIGRFVLGTDGSGAGHLIVRTGAARQPSPTGMSELDDQDHMRRDDFLYMDGSAIFNFTLDAVPAMVNQLLQRHGLELGQVDYFVFHQANKYMLNTIRRLIDVPKERFHIQMSETGNTVSSTVLIALRDALDQKLISPGMTVMIAGFGVGLSWGGTVLKF